MTIGSVEFYHPDIDDDYHTLTVDLELEHGRVHGEWASEAVSWIVGESWQLDGRAIKDWALKFYMVAMGHSLKELEKLKEKARNSAL